VPKTWSIDISWADELDEMWSDDLYELGEFLDENDERDIQRWFILKPSMSDRGQGIRLFESKNALREIFESFEDHSDDESPLAAPSQEQGSDGINTGIIASQLRHFVIQVRNRVTVQFLSKLIDRLRNTYLSHYYLIPAQPSFQVNRRQTFYLALAK
jgi:hypothetical protein